MAYRRPAIEVIQQFQQAAAALALPSLPAVVAGPGFQIVDDVNAGIYDASEAGVQSYPYVGLTTGAIVDLTATPESEAEANAHKAVGVKLQNAYLAKVNTNLDGALLAPNVFQDQSAGAFASFDPDADGAPTFYVEVISGGAGFNSADAGRKLVIGKTDDNNLVVAANWQSTTPVADVEYRILEFRDEEEVPEDEFVARGISKTASAVTISPGLESNDDLPVIEADILLSWRALRPDLAGSLNAFTSLDSLEAVFGVGSVVPSNVGAYAVNLALQNTTTEIAFTGLGGDFFSNEEQAWQDAFEFLEGEDVYGVAVLSHLPAVHQQADSHVENMSQSSVGRERVAFINRTLVEIEVILPSSGIGTVTTAGGNNGTNDADNTLFDDPDNGAFITGGVQVGHFLEIQGYTAVGGADREVEPDYPDMYHSDNVVELKAAEFVSADTGRFLIFEHVAGAGNESQQVAHDIATIVSPSRVTLTVSPTINVELALLQASRRIWICDLVRAITVDTVTPDGVVTVAGVTTFTFNNETFTASDVGRILVVTGLSAASAEDGAYIITSVPTSITCVATRLQAPGDQTFTGAQTAAIYSIDRTVTDFDGTYDSVVGASRTWTLGNGNFTQDDVGRELRTQNLNAGANNDNHIITEVLSSSQVVTSLATTPVDEDFWEFSTALVAADFEVFANEPSSDQDAFITGTLHEIAAVNSESQLDLGSDPTDGFGGRLEDVVYRVIKDLTLNEQASFLAGYASSFANRRLVHTWPDVLAASVNGIATKLPGYFAGPVLSALTAGLPSQQGFTNLTVTGFIGRENSDDKFNDTQLDTIAGGGNFIFVQPVPETALLIRHQLTTDLSTIFFQEFSVTKNVDLIAKFFRNLYRPYTGIYNITDNLLDILKTRGESGVAFLKAQRAPRVGAPLRRGQLTGITESETQPDTVEIEVDVSVPLPLNNIKLTLFV